MNDACAITYVLKSTCVRGPCGSKCAIYVYARDLAWIYESFCGQPPSSDWLASLADLDGLAVGPADPARPSGGLTIRGVAFIEYWQHWTNEKSVSRFGLKLLWLPRRH